MKKSYMKRLICLGVAGILLCSALAVAAITGSAYEVLKEAAFKGVDIKNGVFSMDASIELDGKLMQNESNVMHIGDTATLTRNGDFTHYSTDGYTVTGGPNKYRVYKTDHFDTDSISFIPSDSISSAQRRFIELALDLLVGDLKNNLSMYEKDGIRHITGVLTGEQLPEIVSAGLDLLCAEIADSNPTIGGGEDDEIPVPKRMRISYARGDAQVDKDGNLISGEGELRIDYTDLLDVDHELVVRLNASISDVGSTNPECPIPGVEEMLDSLDEKGFYTFSVKEDGTIDEASVNITYGRAIIN